MDQSSLDILPFIKELDKLLARVLPETIRLELTYQPGSYWVNADPTRLQQIFLNLAVNARDAMPNGGILRFALDRLTLDYQAATRFPGMLPGEWIRIAITDTGSGIAPEIRQHIFEPFFTTKPAGHGTGLGLAQVYGIVKQHDGFIDVQSEVGFGTTFYIYLPALPAVFPVDQILESGETWSGEGETILVVEDNAATREAIQTLLEENNYSVIAATDGIDALSQYYQTGGKIDLVVSDIVMPEMGGMPLYQRLLEDSPSVKMLFITGHPLEEESQALLEQGNVHWLQKPFSIREFNRAVRQLLGESS
jgi:CheY-like chemotaxis protein